MEDKQSKRQEQRYRLRHECLSRGDLRRGNAIGAIRRVTLTKLGVRNAISLALGTCPIVTQSECFEGRDRRLEPELTLRVVNG
jgi:hypothetical protein